MKNAMLMVNFSRNSATYFLSENLYNISQRLILDIKKTQLHIATLPIVYCWPS